MQYWGMALRNQEFEKCGMKLQHLTEGSKSKENDICLELSRCLRNRGFKKS